MDEQQLPEGAPPLPADLALRAIQRELRTQVVGHTMLRYERVGSTNDLAKERAQAGHDEGLVILAEEQRAGRGRMGRAWVSPAGTSLLLSVLLRPSWLSPGDVFAITMVAGVALCEAVEQVAQLRAALKWPNDLLLPAGAPSALHKAAGILCDVRLEGERLAWVVVGIGLNVNWTPAGTVDGRDLAASATSVAAAVGGPVDRGALLRALLRRLDARYLALRGGGRDELFAAWRGRLATIGQQVAVRLPGGELHGLAEDVEPSGALRVRDAHGTLHLVTAGDVNF
ncbi:MAG TPA: biotin--[acetyl-CoA-carboxylase] ligase [Roseiflexaceae bacterium]|nr:biotin--[acetyl-CoA-carboxylase] ligase [Roseiflexaceae bacterium]